ncbi:hypothetical protein J2S92_000920 [Arthrobacter bambusae]|nr:hypothetical protein [Arthrobacter bambusae]MDQ0234698.1 hypothetical protein [Arthrobacter bambusae]
MFGISAVPVPSGEDRGEAEVLVATQAKGAASAGSPEPCDSYPVTAPEPHTPFAGFADYSHRFVARYDVRPPRGKVAFGQMQIRAADTTGSDTDEEFPPPRARIGPLAPNQRL